MITFIATNDIRQELHATAASAEKSRSRWVSLGFDARIVWTSENFDDQQTVVIVK